MINQESENSPNSKQLFFGKIWKTMKYIRLSNLMNYLQIFRIIIHQHKILFTIICLNILLYSSIIVNIILLSYSKSNRYVNNAFNFTKLIIPTIVSILVGILSYLPAKYPYSNLIIFIACILYTLSEFLNSVYRDVIIQIIIILISNIFYGYGFYVRLLPIKTFRDKIRNLLYITVFSIVMFIIVMVIIHMTNIFPKIQIVLYQSEFNTILWKIKVNLLLSYLLILSFSIVTSIIFQNSISGNCSNNMLASALLFISYAIGLTIKNSKEIFTINITHNFYCYPLIWIFLAYLPIGMLISYRQYWWRIEQQKKIVVPFEMMWI